MAPNKDHALLSPSASWRWLNCTPSARLTEAMPDEPSVYAEEGTKAHRLCELRANNLFNRLSGREKFGHRVDTSDYDQEMIEASDVWLEVLENSVKEIGTKGWYTSVEEDLDLSRWIPEGHGTADCVLLTDKVLGIYDFKYGQGVKVDAERNTQLMCYALGAFDKFGLFFDIEEVRLTIVQPRLDHISEWSLKLDDLLCWGETRLKPFAEMAFRGEGVQTAGDWCRFCNVRPICRVWYEKEQQAAATEFRYDGRVIGDEELTEILPALDGLISWAQSVKDYALNRALEGVKYPGWKLVEGRSVRAFTDEEAAADRLRDMGLDPREPAKILSVAKAEKLVGKKDFGAKFGDLVAKNAGKPVLVPEDDKRPEWNSAANDFGNLPE